LPAIDLPLFTRLLTQSTETTGPYKWQISWWAQIARRGLRYYMVTRHTRKYFKPFEIQGRENLKGLKGPAIFIANHSSHFDSLAVTQALPERYRRRVAFGGAADRWFLKGRKGMQKQGWWNSLSLNTWPIKRGAGRSSLEYGEWLIDKGWSLMIFPEGTRSTTGKMGNFKHGVTLLALAKDVPVVPMYFEGLREIRPKGSQAQQPGPVTAAIGRPIRFAAETPVPEATKTLYRAMDEMRTRLRPPRRASEGQPDSVAELASGG
jgi:long-chain acyl-CoA synthetase